MSAVEEYRRHSSATTLPWATANVNRAISDAANHDMWQLAEEIHHETAENVRLQAIVYRQDLTILALWSLLEKAEKAQAPYCDTEGEGSLTCYRPGRRP